MTGSQAQPPRIGVSIGDPAGIGPELVVRLLADPGVAAIARPIAYGSLQLLRRVAVVAGLPEPDPSAVIDLAGLDVAGDDLLAGQAAHEHIERVVGRHIDEAERAVCRRRLGHPAGRLAARLQRREFVPRSRIAPHRRRRAPRRLRHRTRGGLTDRNLSGPRPPAPAQLDDRIGSVVLAVFIGVLIGLALSRVHRFVGAAAGGGISFLAAPWLVPAIVAGLASLALVSLFGALSQPMRRSRRGMFPGDDWISYSSRGGWGGGGFGGSFGGSGGFSGGGGDFGGGGASGDW